MQFRSRAYLKYLKHWWSFFYVSGWIKSTKQDKLEVIYKQQTNKQPNMVVILAPIAKPPLLAMDDQGSRTH